MLTVQARASTSVAGGGAQAAEADCATDGGTTNCVKGKRATYAFLPDAGASPVAVPSG